MIRSISFSETPKSRYEELKPFYGLTLPKLRGKTFEFSRGINFIVGYNGCGKSTLFNIIKRIFFCTNSLHSSLGKMDDTAFNQLQDILEWDLLSNVTMKANYKQSLFSMMEHTFMSDSINIPDEESASRNIIARKESMGLRTFNNLQAVFDLFGDDTKNSIKLLRETVWKPLARLYWTYIPGMSLKPNDMTIRQMVTAVLRYYKKNMIPSDLSSYDWTVLLDEPDRNTDPWISYLMLRMLRAKMLTKHRGATLQHLIILHNPIILHRLWKLYCENEETLKDWVKFIELTPGYLNSVDELINGKELTPIKTYDWTIQNNF